MASPTVVQSVAKTTASTVSSLQLTGLSTTAGNLYLLSVAERSAGASISSVTDSASNTWAKQVATSGGVAAGSEIWTTTNDSPAAITSVTVNLGSTINLAFRFFEISGANNTNPNIATVNAKGSTASINSGASPAPWPASSLAIASTASAQSTQDYTAAQSFTAGTPTVQPSTTTADFSNVVGSETMLQTAYLALNTTSAQTYTETLSTSHGWSVAVLIIPAAINPHVVQTVGSTNTAAQTTRTLSGLTTTAGNLFLLTIGASAGSSIVSSVTDSAGNSWAKRVQVNQASNADSEIWTTTGTFPAAITSVTVNLSGGGSRFAFRFWEIARALNAGPLGASSGSTGTGSNSVTTGATGTPPPGSLAIATVDAQLGNSPLFASAQTFTSSAPASSEIFPTSLTSEISDGGAGAQADLQSAYILNITAAQTFTVTISGTCNWAATIICIPPAQGDPTRTGGTGHPWRGPFVFTPVVPAPVFAAPPYSSYAATVLSDSPDLYWRMNDSGTLATDYATPGGHNGTLHGTVTKGVAGALANDIDPAMTFDASSGYIDQSSYHPVGGALTLECWVNIQNNPTNHGFVMGWRDNNNQDFYILQLSGTDTFETRWRPAGTQYTQTSSAITANAWHHLVFRFDGTNTLSFFIDGSKDKTDWSDGSTGLQGTTANFFVARDPLGSNFSGAIIDEVAVYHSALSDARILAHYQAGSTASHSYTVSISESLTAASDSVARVYVGARTLTESLTAASDAVARAYTGSRSIAESVGASSDAVARVYTGARTVSESASASDAVARSYTGSRSIAESVGASSDTVARVFSGARTISEALTAASDSVSRVYTGARTVSESVSASDAVARAYIGARTIAESVSASDAATRAYTGSRSVAESVGAASDSVARVVAWVRAASESVGASSDTVTRVYTGNRAVNEALTAASDAVARAYTGSRAISESTSASDSVARAFIGARSISESVGPASDSVATGHQNFITVSETVGAAADAVTRVFVGSRSIAESVAASDAVARIYVGARAIAESVAASDAVSRGFTGSRTVVENVSASDAVSRMFNPARSVAEVVGPATDANTVSRGFSRVIVETVGPATDSITRHVVLSRLIAEVVGPASDTVVPLTQQPRSNIVIPMLFRDGTVAFIFRDGSMALIFKS